MTRRLPGLAFLILACLSCAAAAVVEGQTFRPQLLGLNEGAFFDDTVLHEIHLTINTKDYQSLTDDYLADTYYPCDFAWRDIVVRNVGIRSRGLASRSSIKPGLRVDFDRYTTDQKFLGLKSFVLRNNTLDPSNMHERLSMLLYRRLGIPVSREAHTKLFVNNAYVGLYSIVESVDKSFLRRTYNDDNGYLFKYEWTAPYYFEDKGSTPETYVPAPFKPETNEQDSRPEVLVQLIQAINQGASFRSAIAPYLDLQKFIRFAAAEMFVADNDNFMGDSGVANFYMYRTASSNSFTFIGWDKSNAFTSPDYSVFKNLVGVPAAKQNRLMVAALSSRDLYDQYLDVLLECVKSISEPGAGDGRGWLEREIEREYAQIRDAALSDTEKPFTNADFETAVEALRNFARQRGDLVTAEVNQARTQPVITTRRR